MAEVNDVAFISTPLPAHHELSIGRRVSTLGFVLLASWLFPAAAARRSLELSLFKCWLLHFFLGLFGGLSLAAAVIAINDSPRALAHEVNWVWREWTQWPITTSLIMLGIALAIEAGHLTLAFVVCSWGAHSEERLRDSFGHALRQTFLRMPHALLIALILCVFVTVLDRARDRWRAVHGGLPTVQVGNWPTPPLRTDPNYAAAQRKYNKELRDYEVKASAANRAWEQWRQSQPWHVRHDEPLAIALGMLGSGWWLAALLCAVGIERKIPSKERSPRCLFCGYDLTTMSMESRCPECGEAVLSSLGPDAQPGTPWEKRSSEGLVATWWKTWRTGVSYSEFGRRLQLSAQPSHTRKFLFLHLPLVFAIGVVGLLAGIAQGAGIDELLRDKPATLLFGSLFGMACVLGTTLVACGSASLVGSLVSLRSGRNLLPAARQAAGYCAPYLATWAFFGAVLINCVMHLYLSGLFRLPGKWTGIDGDLLIFLACFLPNAACALACLVMIGRITAAARYANK